MTVMWNAERSGAVPVTFHPRSTPVIGQIPGTERVPAFHPGSAPVERTLFFTVHQNDGYKSEYNQLG